LLARLLPTPKKSVFIDDVDVCDVPLSFVRRALGYAQQDAFLFSTTVSRNIGYALPDTESEVGANIIRDAAREAQVLEEALGLPEQFDTVVGERGVQLSGGQKQRIALARALAWEPKILILDDPLSAVDAKTEAAILKSIERQAEKRTIVLITHRIAAAARCDYVIVLDQGRVLERGTHDELIAARGLYAAFAEEQRMARELAEMEAESVPSNPPRANEAGAA
ncbi:MAG: ABC transporter ATP-binding protein, partial [Polyangiaceae bacterium]